MSLSSDTVMPVAPVGYSGGSNSGNGGAWGADGAWIIILFFIFALCGGWGNGAWGGNGNNGGATPYATSAVTQSDLARGFDAQAIQTKLDAMTNGMCQQGYQTQEGFHGVDNAICTLGYQIQGGMNGINTTMLQGFNAQNVALMQGQNALATQLADCCCQEQRGMDAISYNMATQNCATQNVIQNSTRDIIDNQNCNTRQILDYLCQDKISTLQTENQALRLAASQQAQNSYLVNTLRPAPLPAYNVPNPYFAPVPVPAPAV